MNERLANADAAKLKAGIAHLRDICGSDDPELLGDMIEGETSVDVFVGKMIELIQLDETDVKALGGYAKQIGDRKKRIDTRAKRLRTLLASVVYELPERRFRHPLALVTASDVDPKPIIEDESLIPSQWWKPQDPKLDESGIRAHLLERQKLLDGLKECRTDEERDVRRAEIDAEFPDIPGASLDNGDITISIRSA